MEEEYEFDFDEILKEFRTLSHCHRYKRYVWEVGFSGLTN